MTNKISRSSTTSTFVNKRQYPRREVHNNVRLEVDGEVIVGETNDISMGGVSIMSETHIGNDAFVQMHIENIGEMTGHVVRETDDGFAVQFDDAVTEEKERLETYLQSMFDGDEPEPPSAEDVEKNLKSMFEKD